MPRTDIPEFLFPRKLVSQRGGSRRIGALLRAGAVPTGAVLVVADRVVHDLGLTAATIAGLVDSGYQPEVFSPIAGEPVIGDVEQIAAQARRRDAVAVIGIGGGSAIDTAKVVAYSTVSATPLIDLKGPLPEIADYPPLVLVPTTVGTGAEATRVAMVSVDGAKRILTCPQFVPAMAVLDADLVTDLPGPVVAATALDALAHAVESMLSTNSNDLTRQFSVQAARIILTHLRSAVDGSDAEARAELLHASFLAGVALNAGVVIGHSLSYVLANRLHLAHGVGCAVALPYCLAYNQSMGRAETDAVARAVLDRPQATLRDLADDIAQLTKDVGIPQSLVDVGLGEDESAQLAAELVTNYPRPTNPVPLRLEDVATLISHLRTGDLAGAWTSFGADR